MHDPSIPSSIRSDRMSSLCTASSHHFVMCTVMISLTDILIPLVSHLSLLNHQVLNARSNTLSALTSSLNPSFSFGISCAAFPFPLPFAFAVGLVLVFAFAFPFALTLILIGLLLPLLSLVASAFAATLAALSFSAEVGVTGPFMTDAEVGIEVSGGAFLAGAVFSFEMGGGPDAVLGFEVGGGPFMIEPILGIVLACDWDVPFVFVEVWDDDGLGAVS